ncbi:MAG: hypothetical protein AAF415_11725 [Pseudomonadota bacterium]
MPLQNRVAPTGEITASPWRGAMMGNRGCLHDAQQRLGRARWRHQNWVCCVTEFRGRHRLPMPPPGSPTIYTALFFWDEATAFAAGHRPCGECRYQDYRRFMATWQLAGLPGRGPKEVDRHLHHDRTMRNRNQKRHRAKLADLPPGTFILVQDMPVLLNDGAWSWSPDGYAPYRADLPEAVTVLTPKASVEVFRAGYRPQNRLKT